MLIPLHWLSTTQALVLLAAGAALLVTLTLLNWRPQPRPFLIPACAVLGLWIIATALSLLKNRILQGGPVENDPNFLVLRNAESLAWSGVPLTLAALRQPNLGRPFATALGLAGLGLLAVLAWAGVESWSAEESFRIRVTRIPGASLLARDGNLAAARWFWCFGSALIAIPAARVLWRRYRRMPQANIPELDLVLVGLALTSEAMAIFFWHHGDDRHRFYADLAVWLIAVAAPLLVLGEGRIASVRWAWLALGALSLPIAVWLLLGVAGGDFESGYQELADIALPMLLFLLLLVIPPLLLLHLAVQGIVRAVRRRQSVGQGGLGRQHLE